jgi:sugar phosphate isomerase/epimerase
MKLGIGTYTYTWSIGEGRMTARGLVDKAVELGVDVVQFGPNLPLDSQPEFRARDLELEMGTKGLDAGHLASQAGYAAAHGIRLLRTVPDYDKRAVPPSANELVSALAPLVPTLDRAGVSLAIENATIPAAVLAEALDRLASPRVGITLDTVNSLAIPEGAEHVARTLAPYTLCLHIKDFSIDRVWHMMGFTVEGRPAGQGQLNIPWLLDLIRSAGRSPNAILELWPPRQSTIEETLALEERWAVESIEYLRQLIPEEKHND